MSEPCLFAPALGPIRPKHGFPFPLQTALRWAPGGTALGVNGGGILGAGVCPGVIPKGSPTPMAPALAGWGGGPWQGMFWIIEGGKRRQSKWYG